MAQKLLKAKKRKIVPKKAAERTSTASPKIVLVGTYKDKQLKWIKENGIYNYPVKDGDEFDAESFAKIKELWLYADTKGRRHCFTADFVKKMTQAEFVAAYPTYAKLGKSKQKAYYVFKASFLDYGPKLDAPDVLVRVIDFATGYAKQVKKAVDAYRADGGFGSLAHYLPTELSRVPRERLRVCDSGTCLPVWSPVKGMTPQQEKIESIVSSVAEFGRTRSMSVAEAYKYLEAYAGLDFLDKHYSISRCYSDEMIDESLSKVCRNNGGRLK